MRVTTANRHGVVVVVALVMVVGVVSWGGCGARLWRETIACGRSFWRCQKLGAARDDTRISTWLQHLSPPLIDAAASRCSWTALSSGHTSPCLGLWITAILFLFQTSVERAFQTRIWESRSLPHPLHLQTCHYSTVPESHCAEHDLVAFPGGYPAGEE